MLEHLLAALALTAAVATLCFILVMMQKAFDALVDWIESDVSAGIKSAYQWVTSGLGKSIKSICQWVTPKNKAEKQIAGTTTAPENNIPLPQTQATGTTAQPMDIPGSKKNQRYQQPTSSDLIDIHGSEWASIPISSNH